MSVYNPLHYYNLLVSLFLLSNVFHLCKWQQKHFKVIILGQSICLQPKTAFFITRMLQLQDWLSADGNRNEWFFIWKCCKATRLRCWKINSPSSFCDSLSHKLKKKDILNSLMVCAAVCWGLWKHQNSQCHRPKPRAQLQTLWGWRLDCNCTKNLQKIHNNKIMRMLYFYRDRASWKSRHININLYLTVVSHGNRAFGPSHSWRPRCSI